MCHHQVDIGYYIVDSLIGYIMFIIIALLAFLGVPAILQVMTPQSRSRAGLPDPGRGYVSAGESFMRFQASPVNLAVNLHPPPTRLESTSNGFPSHLILTATTHPHRSVSLLHPAATDAAVVQRLVRQDGQLWQDCQGHEGRQGRQQQHQYGNK